MEERYRKIVDGDTYKSIFNMNLAWRYRYFSEKPSKLYVYEIKNNKNYH